MADFTNIVGSLIDFFTNQVSLSFRNFTTSIFSSGGSGDKIEGEFRRNHVFFTLFTNSYSAFLLRLFFSINKFLFWFWYMKKIINPQQKPSAESEIKCKLCQKSIINAYFYDTLTSYSFCSFKCFNQRAKTYPE